jgi:hypothetical protein
VNASATSDALRRRKIRRTAIICGLIAAVFYLGFIIMAVVRANS